VVVNKEEVVWRINSLIEIADDERKAVSQSSIPESWWGGCYAGLTTALALVNRMDDE